MSMRPVAFIGLLVWMQGMSSGVPELSSANNLLLAFAGIAIVFTAFDIFIFYLILFSSILWLKYGCGAICVVAVVVSFVTMFTPTLILDSTDTQRLALLGSWVEPVALLANGGLYAWVGSLMWRDIQGLRLNTARERAGYT
jgi:hypothetical protein